MITHFQKIIITTFSFFIILLSVGTVHAVDPLTITIYTTYDSGTAYTPHYVGTVTVDPQCNTSSPVSYTWRLDVNGLVIVDKKSCPRPPTVEIHFSLKQKIQSYFDRLFALLINTQEKAFAETSR